MMSLKDSKFWEGIMPLTQIMFTLCQASAGIKMTEHFAPWKVKFDIDFDIKPVMTDDEKVAEHKLVGSLMAAEQKMGFTG